MIADQLLRFAGRGPEVRGGDHIRALNERIGGGGRLLLEHVERRAGQAPARERAQEGGLVDDPAARDVHEPRPRLHAGEGGVIDEVAGGGRERHVEGDEIGLGEHVGQGSELDPALLPWLRHHERIMDQDPHPERRRAAGDFAPDPPVAEDAEGLAEELHAEEPPALPLPGLHRAIGGRNRARERQHERERVLGGGDRVPARRVHHQHAAPGGRLHVHVVDPGAGACDHLELGAGLDHLAGDLGPTADDEGIERGNRLHQLRRGQTQAHVHLDARLGFEQGDGLGDDRVGDEDAPAHAASQQEARNHKDGSKFRAGADKMVELTGIEPVTSCLPDKRSPS